MLYNGVILQDYQDLVAKVKASRGVERIMKKKLTASLKLTATARTKMTKGVRMKKFPVLNETIQLNNENSQCKRQSALHDLQRG